MFISWLERSNILFSIRWLSMLSVWRNSSLAIFQFDFEVSRSSRNYEFNLMMTCLVLSFADNLSPYSVVQHYRMWNSLCDIFVPFHDIISARWWESQNGELWRTWEHQNRQKQIASVKNRWNSLVIVTFSLGNLKIIFCLELTRPRRRGSDVFSRQQRSQE